MAMQSWMHPGGSRIKLKDQVNADRDDGPSDIQLRPARNPHRKQQATLFDTF
jgi:hypothetical protein